MRRRPLRGKPTEVKDIKEKVSPLIIEKNKASDIDVTSQANEVRSISKTSSSQNGPVPEEEEGNDRRIKIILFSVAAFILIGFVIGLVFYIRKYKTNQ